MNIRNILLAMLTINALLIGSIATTQCCQIAQEANKVATKIAKSPAISGAAVGALAGAACSVRQPNFVVVLINMGKFALGGGVLAQAYTWRPQAIVYDSGAIYIEYASRYPMTKIALPKRIQSWLNQDEFDTINRRNNRRTNNIEA